MGARADRALTSGAERERKFEVRGEDVPAGLPELLVGAGRVGAVRDAGAVSLEAVYHDTADRRLAAEGITLRRRTGGDDAGWHLKLPLRPDAGEVAGGDAREEIRAPLGDVPPPALMALVRSRIRRAEPLPLVTIRTERARHVLLDGAGEALAELALDRVTAEREGRTATWVEVEVELAEGADPGLLDAAEERLAAAGLARSAARSKLHRALTETGAPPAGEAAAAAGAAGASRPLRDGTAGAQVLGYVRRQIRAIVAFDPAARRELPDAVHQMRVATRRLRSCLRSYRPVLDRAVTDPLCAELAWLAAELGADRDREVLAARLADRHAELARPLRVGPLSRRLRSASRSQRASSRRTVLAALDSDRYLDLLDALDGLLTRPPLRRAAARPARKVLKRAVRRDRERLAARVEAALATPPGPARDVALHDARKAAKRARYTTEAARGALGGRSVRAELARLRRVQEVLGDHQDSVLARQALLRLASDAQRAGEPSFSYGVLYQREVELAAAGEDALRRLFSAA